MKREDIYYEAMRARDHRFDGKFFVGVRTTGIYCRPICPAQPKRENTVFFPNHLVAERAGYRPCLRCRPESAPESPAWIGTSAIVRRAVRKLYDHHAIDLNEDRFAGLFGVSARHLRRVFIEEIGKTPKQLSFENRLNLCRKLIVETRLPVTEIAFASGFKSIRRFNDSFKHRFKKRPTELRFRRRRPSDSAGVKLTLPYRPPFDFDGLMHFYGTHRVASLEWFEAGKMNRIVELGGKVGQIAISNDPRGSRLVVEIDFPSPAMLPAIISRVRSLFDVDSDPVLIANHLERDEKIKALLKKHPGIRLPSGWDPFEVAVASILGQLVSVDRGRALVSDLVEMLGESSGLNREGRPIKLFPSPKRIAASTLQELKTTSARKQTLIAFSKAVAESKLSLDSAQDVDDFIERILAIRGIGPWTASYIALKALRHTDAFPETDLILARAMELHPREAVERMSPWRGYAAALFWREYSNVLKKRKKA